MIVHDVREKPHFRAKWNLFELSDRNEWNIESLSNHTFVTLDVTKCIGRKSMSVVNNTPLCGHDRDVIKMYALAQSCLLNITKLGNQTRAL